MTKLYRRRTPTTATHNSPTRMVTMIVHARVELVHGCHYKVCIMHLRSTKHKLSRLSHESKRNGARSPEWHAVSL